MNEYEILQLIAETLGYEPVQIISRNKKREIADARHIVAYFIRNYTKLKYAKIGEFLNRHHSTVIQSVKKAIDYSKYDAEFKIRFQQAQNAIENYYLDRRIIK